MTKRFTGWHFTAIMVGGFSIVVAVNLFMASMAVGSFGGVVVENSYVASQNYNKWLADARAEDQLGWTATVTRNGDGQLEITTGGTPVDTQAQVELRHPLGKKEVLNWQLVPQGDGRFVSADRLPEGRWLVRLTLASGDQQRKFERPLG